MTQSLLHEDNVLTAILEINKHPHHQDSSGHERPASVTLSLAQILYPVPFDRLSTVV